MAGIATPVGPVTAADADAYTAAVLVNCASGLVLGKAFLDACRSAGTDATLVVCSSPAAASPVYGASHYGAGKAALQYWAATVATEVDSRVLCVVPYAVDTPMVRRRSPSRPAPRRSPTTCAPPPSAASSRRPRRPRRRSGASCSTTRLTRPPCRSARCPPD